MQPINQWVLYYQGRVVTTTTGPWPRLLPLPGGSAGCSAATQPDHDGELRGGRGHARAVVPGRIRGKLPAGGARVPSRSGVRGRVISYHLRPLPTGDGSFILGRADPSFPSGNNYLGYVVVCQATIFLMTGCVSALTSRPRRLRASPRAAWTGPASSTACRSAWTRTG